MKKLNISLELESVKHLGDKSCYNCNYYELESYGDWCIFFNGNNIIEAICHEEDNFYTYTLQRLNTPTYTHTNIVHKLKSKDE